MSSSDAAAALGVSERTLRRLVSSGKIARKKAGRHSLYRIAAQPPERYDSGHHSGHSGQPTADSTAETAATTAATTDSGHDAIRMVLDSLRDQLVASIDRLDQQARNHADVTRDLHGQIADLSRALGAAEALAAERQQEIERLRRRAAVLEEERDDMHDEIMAHVDRAAEAVSDAKIARALLRMRTGADIDEPVLGVPPKRNQH